MTERDESKDISVQLDETDTVWLTVEPDNTIIEWPDEDAACKYQREWREAHGLHPITGEERCPCDSGHPERCPDVGAENVD